jgi:diaminohydroxyphosphoribosylaminopyrimidine deaminase / 5-amino-6-(5-phosphoribosylamino)uracil reductase
MSKLKKKSFSDSDRRFMLEALDLARKGLGRTSPNPAVGAVIVKNGKIVGRGYHKKAGLAHAEVEAVKNMASVSVAGKNTDGKSLRGCTMYVTLEPCCHENKRTPPCTRFLIKNGLKEVVFAMRDPNGSVSGKGAKELKKAGIIVREGLLADEAARLNEIYVKNITTGMPFVMLKMAVSIDGKIAAQNGESRWISGHESRTEVHRLRNIYDAVLTSSSTVMKDDPHLGVRHVRGRDPVRVILDRELKTDSGSKVYRDKNAVVVTAARDGGGNVSKFAVFAKKGIRVLRYDKWPELGQILADLKKPGICSVMIETGPKLATAFLRDKLVDKCIFFVAPKIIGSGGHGAVDDLNVAGMSDVFVLKNVRHTVFGDDVMIEGYF